MVRIWGINSAVHIITQAQPICKSMRMRPSELFSWVRAIRLTDGGADAAAAPAAAVAATQPVALSAASKATFRAAGLAPPSTLPSDDGDERLLVRLQAYYATPDGTVQTRRIKVPSARSKISLHKEIEGVFGLPVNGPIKIIVMDAQELARRIHVYYMYIYLIYI